MLFVEVGSNEFTHLNLSTAKRLNLSTLFDPNLLQITHSGAVDYSAVFGEAGAMAGAVE